MHSFSGAKKESFERWTVELLYWLDLWPSDFFSILDSVLLERREEEGGETDRKHATRSP